MNKTYQELCDEVVALRESNTLLSASLKKADDERAALAAHVERMNASIDDCYGDATRMHLEVGDIRDKSPETSLAKHDIDLLANLAFRFEREAGHLMANDDPHIRSRGANRQKAAISLVVEVNRLRREAEGGES